MAPGITEHFDDNDAERVPVDVLKKASGSGGYHHGGEADGAGAGAGAASYAAQHINKLPNTCSPLNAEEHSPLFTMPSMYKLQEAQRRVEHDFRSDTVTVPTVHMMQVSGQS